MGTDTKLRTTTEYKINGHFVHREVWEVVKSLRKQIKDLEYRVLVERRDKDLYAEQLRTAYGVD